MSAIFPAVIISLIIKHLHAEKLSFGSTSGCDSACQKECIDVINKYRVNHHAKKAIFSQFLADKAQKWADGGTFGYDMKSRGKYGQLIEWDVKNELQNFTTVIKHWHDKEKDYDFGSSHSKTGKTLHDFTQIVWKKVRKAGCAQSEIFGSKYYVVWMDSDGLVNPNIEAGEENIGSPEKDDIHWYETSFDADKEKANYLKPSRLHEETSLTRQFVRPEESKLTSTKGYVRSEPNKPINTPDMNEVQEEQRVLNNNAILKQYLFQDSLNNIVLNENKETASYHVVPGAMDNATWQKGAESLIHLNKSKPKLSSEKQNGEMSMVPAEAEDDKKEAARFQSLVIQDDDMLMKGEEDYNGTVSSQGNGGDEFGADENKQAAVIQSLMKQEDDMIQNQDDDGDEEYSGKSSKLPSNEASGHSAENLGGKSTSYYTSGVALNKNPNESAPSKPSGKLMLDPVGGNFTNSSVKAMTSQYMNDSYGNVSINIGRYESKNDRLDNATTAALLQSDNLVDQQVFNQSKLIGRTEENHQREDIGANNEGNAFKPGSSSAVLTTQNVLHIDGKPEISRMARIQKTRAGKTINRDGKISPISQVKVSNIQPQKPVLATPFLYGQVSTETPVSSLQSSETTEQTAAIPSTEVTTFTDSAAIADIHHVSSPALIKLPSSNSRPIKLVFHVKDMNSNVNTAGGYQTVSAYQSTTDSDDITTNMYDDECQDDTLQCPLWAHHGHCRGTAYAEFMKRHCKATCGYCGLPSVIKESTKLKQPINLTQDEICEDDATYEFSCPRWQAQGYCEKKEKEMRLVCRKTCEFCVPTEQKSRAPSSFRFSPSSLETKVNELHHKSDSNTQPTTNSQQFTKQRRKPHLYDIVKTKPKSTGNQSQHSVPLQPPKKLFTLQNNQEPPKSSSLKSSRPVESLMLNQSTSHVENLKEAHDISSHALGNETTNETAGNLTTGNYKENVGLHDSLKPMLKQTRISANLRNDSRMTNRLKLNASSLPIITEQGETEKVGNFMKAPAVKITLQSKGPFKPQADVLSSLLKNFPNNQFSSQQEDKLIENGIKALQHRLQAPLEISAVAKSKPGCGERLCKAKPKFQQAKTRETIGSPVFDALNASKNSGTLVSTKGCDASCQKKCLEAHNRYRLNHGAAPLVLDQKLASQAQQWADKKLFRHSPWAGGQGGETIALGSLYPSFTAAVKAWHDEEKDYDWSTGEGAGGMKVNHFTQVVWKGARSLGCGKTFINGEPYYIAQMDTPGVIAGEPGFDKSNVGKPKEPDLHWYMDSSPYWKEMQTKDSIPKDIEHLIL